MRRTLAFFTLSAFLYTLLGGCSTTMDAVLAELMESTERIDAVEFPELILTDGTGREREVKILSVQGCVVTVSPFPYWFLEPEEIPLSQIRTLEVKKRSYPGLTATVITAELGFIIGGGLAGVFAETNRGWYGLALTVGLLSALLGAGAALFSGTLTLDQEVYPEYDLSTMSERGKLQRVLEIMGVL